MPNELALQNTVALVTGASSGIGEATARRLAAEGAAVAVAARRLDRLERLAREIDDAGGRALAIESDVTDRAQAEALVERTVAELGRLDTVVNNAGVMLLGPFTSEQHDEQRQMIETNLMGAIATTEVFLDQLRDGGGDLVNISSVAGRRPRAASAVYNLTKFGVGAFSEALRQEVTERHVRVSVVEPGAVETELASHNRPAVQEAMKARFGDIERLQAGDIADTISYIVTRPRHMAINEILVRPTEQEN